MLTLINHDFLVGEFDGIPWYRVTGLTWFRNFSILYSVLKRKLSISLVPDI